MIWRKIAKYFTAILLLTFCALVIRQVKYNIEYGVDEPETISFRVIVYYENGQLAINKWIEYDGEEDFLDVLDRKMEIEYVEYEDKITFLKIGHLEIDREENIYFYVFLNDEYLRKNIKDIKPQDDDIVSFKLHYFGNIIY